MSAWTNGFPPVRTVDLSYNWFAQDNANPHGQCVNAFNERQGIMQVIDLPDYIANPDFVNQSDFATGIRSFVYPQYYGFPIETKFVDKWYETYHAGTINFDQWFEQDAWYDDSTTKAHKVLHLPLLALGTVFERQELGGWTRRPVSGLYWSEASYTANTIDYVINDETYATMSDYLPEWTLSEAYLDDDTWATRAIDGVQTHNEGSGAGHLTYWYAGDTAIYPKIQYVSTGNSGNTSTTATVTITGNTYDNYGASPTFELSADTEVIAIAPNQTLDLTKVWAGITNIAVSQTTNNTGDYIRVFYADGTVRYHGDYRLYWRYGIDTMIEQYWANCSAVYYTNRPLYRISTSGTKGIRTWTGYGWAGLGAATQESTSGQLPAAWQESAEMPDYTNEDNTYAYAPAKVTDLETPTVTVISNVSRAGWDYKVWYDMSGTIDLVNTSGSEQTSTILIRCQLPTGAYLSWTDSVTLAASATTQLNWLIEDLYLTGKNELAAITVNAIFSSSDSDIKVSAWTADSNVTDLQPKINLQRNYGTIELYNYPRFKDKAGTIPLYGVRQMYVRGGLSFNASGLPDITYEFEPETWCSTLLGGQYLMLKEFHVSDNVYESYADGAIDTVPWDDGKLVNERGFSFSEELGGGVSAPPLTLCKYDIRDETNALQYIRDSLTIESNLTELTTEDGLVLVYE